MSRFAVLIEASKLTNHEDLPGARQDVEAYKAFLTSDFGGAWQDQEIHVLSHPSKTLLMEWIEIAGRFDYSFVAFSGHGHHVVGKRIDETRVCINDSEEVPVYDLNTGSGRCLVAADSCRKVTRLLQAKSAGEFRMSLQEAEETLRPNRERCRQLFDASVLQAEKGAIYMYSCDLDEAASDSYSFSRALVEAGEAWAEKRKSGILWSNEAFHVAAAATSQRNKQQHPKMDAGRRTVHFPFAVLAY
jgi:hypothetical protein